MSKSLLDQFLAEECTPYVRSLLEKAIDDQAVARPRFEFNRFEVTVDRTQSAVVLKDVLDVTEDGAEQLPLADFVNALNA